MNIGERIVIRISMSNTNPLIHSILTIERFLTGSKGTEMKYEL